jgi:opacity protein-like surface antigen
LLEGIELHQQKYAKRRETMKRVTLVAVCLLFISAIAVAADDVPMVEIFGGYQLLHPYESIHGFTADIEANIHKNFSIVGVFAFGDKGDSDYYYGYKTFSYAGGPRFSYRSEKFRFFSHALFGATHHSDNSPENYTENDFTMAFGGGFDIALHKNISIRPAQLDVFNVKYQDYWESGYRFSTGIVFKLGAK